MADDEGLPSVEDFQFLHEIDVFNAKIKQAVTALERLYPFRFVEMLLLAHAYRLMPESPIVNRLALEADDKTGGAWRPEIAERMVTAGALSDASPKRIRQRLSEARRERGDLVDVDALDEVDELDEHVDEELEDALDKMQEAESEAEATASIAMARLLRLGVFIWEDLKLIVAGRLSPPIPSVLKTDASELNADASVLKTDG